MRKATAPEMDHPAADHQGRRCPSIAAAAKLVDDPRTIGAFDPVDMQQYDPFRDASVDPFLGPAYRSQDEYLEWGSASRQRRRRERSGIHCQWPGILGPDRRGQGPSDQLCPSNDGDVERPPGAGELGRAAS